MSEKHTLTGTITHKMDLQTFDSGFTKREFVVCDDAEKYPQEVKLELIKDKCAILDKIPLNSKVTVHFNIRGNEYKGKFYVNLQAWRIEVLEEGDNQPPKGSESWEEMDKKAEAEEDVADDIPF